MTTDNVDRELRRIMESEGVTQIEAREIYLTRLFGRHQPGSAEAQAEHERKVDEVRTALEERRT